MMKHVLGLFVFSWAVFSQVYSGSQPELVLTAPVTGPTSIAIQEGDLLAIISQHDSSSYVSFDLTNNTVLEEYNYAQGPFGVAAGSSGGYITDTVHNHILVLHADFKGVHHSINTGHDPFDVILSPDLASIYNTNRGDNNVTIYNNSTYALENTISVGTHPEGLAVNTTNTKIYVANNSSGTVSVINVADSSVTAINVGNGPKGVAFTPDNSKVCVPNSTDGTLSVIDAVGESVIATITVGAGASQVAISPDSNTAYVTNYDAGTLSVVDLTDNEVTHTVEIGGTPNDIALTSNGKMAYITNTKGNIISIVRLTTSLESVQAAGSTQSTQGQWCKEYYTKLTWQGGDNVARYEIYKDKKIIATLGANVYEYIDNNIDPDDDATYLLHIVTKDGEIFPHTFWMQ